MFGKEKKKSKNNIILAMVMLEDSRFLEMNEFCKDFKAHYKKVVSDPTGDESTFSCTIDGEFIVIGYMNFPVPQRDIEGTAQYAYNWETAVDDLKNHKSHLIITLTSSEQSQVNRFKIFTEVICSLLRITNAVGVYKGTQSLLIPKNDYLHEAGLMSDDYSPLNLWIYFGYKITRQGNSTYTYGLKAFNKSEMEIIDSSKSLAEISKFLFNMTHYVLDNDVTFKDGQTCGTSAEEKIPISFSKGKYVEDKTFKLAY